LKLPLKFKAPKQVSKVPDSISKDEIKKYFDKNTKDFIKILEELPVDLEDKLIFKHPISGLFSITQTLNFVREHYLHHERQLNALL
jgi:DNA-binding transcriptional regulator GbsR (MarR family)